MKSAAIGVLLLLSQCPVPALARMQVIRTVPSLIAGHNYYISASGSDSNDGSEAHPWLTFAHADTLVSAGDVIHVFPGTYNESPRSTQVGTAAAPIVWISDVPWGAVIEGNGLSNWGFRADGAYTVISGFDVTNVNATGHEGVEADGDHDVVFHCRVHDVFTSNDGTVAGAGIINGSDLNIGNTSAISNLVFNIGDTTVASCLVHGIYFEAPGGIIQNNLIYSIQSWGIQLWHNASSITISNNLIFSAQAGGILVGDGDAPCPGACGLDDYTIVTNNIAVYNGNSAPCGIGGYGVIEDGMTGTHNQYANNLTYMNPVSDYRLQNGLTPSNAVYTDPLFVDWQPDGTGDYHLTALSPAVGSGTTLGPAPTFDYAGAPRPLPLDMGIYVYP